MRACSKGMLKSIIMLLSIGLWNLAQAANSTAPTIVNTVALFGQYLKSPNLSTDEIKQKFVACIDDVRIHNLDNNEQRRQEITQLV